VVEAHNFFNIVVCDLVLQTVESLQILFSETNRAARERGDEETAVIVKTFRSSDGIGDRVFVSIKDYEL